MPAISRSQLLKELVPGLNKIFGLEYATYPEEYKEIFTMDTSEKAFEEELKISGFGAAPVKTEGAGIAYDTAQEAWTARYVHETIALGFTITEEAIEDNLYATLSKRYTKALARAMAYTREVKGGAILNLAFTSGYNGGDGVVLCSTAHPLVNGGTNSNRPTTGADLNETSFEAATIQMAGWTDERGLLIAAKPVKGIFPPALAFSAERLFKSTLRPGTMNNDVNAIKSMNTLPQGWSINHYLTDTNAWFIKTDVPNGLTWFNRVPRKESMEGDFDTGNVRYKSRERFSCGWTDPLGLFGSPGST